MIGKLEKKPYEVPFIVYESTVDRLERIIKRLWILAIIIFMAFVVSNGVWIWYDGQYVDVVNTTEIDAEQGDGTNIIAGGDYHGAESQDN